MKKKLVFEAVRWLFEQFHENIKHCQFDDRQRVLLIIDDLKGCFEEYVKKYEKGETIPQCWLFFFTQVNKSSSLMHNIVLLAYNALGNFLLCNRCTLFVKPGEEHLFKNDYEKLVKCLFLAPQDIPLLSGDASIRKFIMADYHFSIQKMIDYGWHWFMIFINTERLYFDCHIEKIDVEALAFGKSHIKLTGFLNKIKGCWFCLMQYKLP